MESAAPENISELALRSGLGGHDVKAALALLGEAGLVVRRVDGGAAAVCLVRDVLVPAPAVTHVRWSDVRLRLRDVGGSVAPSLAVLRELAALVGTVELDGARAPVVRASVRDLEDATSFGRSTVAEALAALERARIVDIETRAGRTTRIALRPAAFGRTDEPPRSVEHPAKTGASHADSEPSAREEAPAETVAAVPPGLQRAKEPSLDSQIVRSPAPGSTTSPAAAGSASTTLLGTFAGTPVYGPPGTALVVECDAEGRWTCRVGPLLVLGPVEP